jgi:hypothetical protein
MIYSHVTFFFFHKKKKIKKEKKKKKKKRREEKRREGPFKIMFGIQCSKIWMERTTRKIKFETQLPSS